MFHPSWVPRNQQVWAHVLGHQRAWRPELRPRPSGPSPDRAAAAPQIPGRCLTCVQFRAFREHVVGRTSALPVSVYDYYEPGRPAPPSRTPLGPSPRPRSPGHRAPRPAAFEATRFYNVSARSPLARELCAGPACNEVERSAAQGPGECAWRSLWRAGPGPQSARS